MILEGRVGDSTLFADGNVATLRQDRRAALVTTYGHGNCYEAAANKRMFTVATASVGVSVVVGNVAPPAAGAATLLSIYNPTGSGVNAVIHRGMVQTISGTPGVGAFQWCVSWGKRITQVESTVAVPRCNFVGGARSQCIGFSTQALTSGLVHVNLRPLGVATFAAVAAATTAGLVATDFVNGEIVIPPDAVLTLAPAATGTTHVVCCSITWEEVLI
jgi:hypothetical protein